MCIQFASCFLMPAFRQGLSSAILGSLTRRTGWVVSGKADVHARLRPKPGIGFLLPP